MEKSNVSAAERFHYQALDSSKQQIRLLKVRSAERQQQFEIESFELVDAPSFKALSYTWGETLPNFNILIDDEHIRVRENLFRFLQAYQDDDYLWIDQICINQEDPDERNQQVSLMASIYSQCESVILWLGSITNKPNTPILFNTKQDIESLSFLLKQPYFTRVWIVQEVLLARHIDVLVSHPVVGNVWVSWKTMCNVATRSAGALRNLDVPSSALHLLREHGTNIRRDLGGVISIFSHGQCQDTRDRVFGLMGLVEKSDRIPIDYRKSKNEVFLDVIHNFCISYLKKRYEEEDVFQYPNSLGGYYSILLVLSNRMEFPDDQLSSLQEMLRALWKPEIFECQSSSESSDFLPLSAVGFNHSRLDFNSIQDGESYASKVYKPSTENKVCSGSKEGEGEQNHDPTRDHWWFICTGKTYEFTGNVFKLNSKDEGGSHQHSAEKDSILLTVAYTV